MKNSQQTHLVYATSNKGKITEISRHFGFYGIPVNSLGDFVPGAAPDPEETGTTLGENADIKALAYAKALSDASAGASALKGMRFLVISDDTGVFIDGLGGEPGIKVRRWKGYKMGDEEIISYTLERMEDLNSDQRDATFMTVLSLVIVDGDGRVSAPVHFEGLLFGHVTRTADSRRIEGFPFESIFHAIDYDMLLGDMHRLSDEQKWAGHGKNPGGPGIFNHRERAIEKAIPQIKELMGV